MSGIAVANGVVYAGTEVHSSGNGHLYAFAAGGCGSATCAPLWAHVLSRDGIGSVTPVVSNGMVYFPLTYSIYAFRLPATIAAPARPNPATLVPNGSLQRSLPRLTALPRLDDQ